MTAPWSDDLPSAEVLRSAAPRPQEQLLIELLPELEPGTMLAMSAGYAQLARAAACRWWPHRVGCWFLDSYQCELARRAGSHDPDNLFWDCGADFPADEVSTVALPLAAHGEGELVRDLLQAAHGRLGVGGRLVVSTDNPADVWLGEQVERLFGACLRKSADLAAAYIARKSGPLKKIKNYSSEFAFRDAGRLFRMLTRPGVFAHRRLDGGARQLLAALDVQPGERVLEIGCGAGAVSLAAAVRRPGVGVHAVDSSARALACLQQSAALNDISNVTSEHNALGDYQQSGEYDLALANPPYFGQYQITSRFLRAAAVALKPGGRMIVVTKSPEWYREHASAWLTDLQVEASKEYWIVRGKTSRTIGKV